MENEERSHHLPLALYPDLFFFGGPEKGCLVWKGKKIYLVLVYLVTAFVPSETACLANSPGKRRRTAVWISWDVIFFNRLLLVISAYHIIQYTISCYFL